MQTCVTEQHIPSILIFLWGKMMPGCNKLVSAPNVWFLVKWANLHPNNLTPQSSFVVRIGHSSHCSRLSCSWCLAMFHNLSKMNLAFPSSGSDSSGDASSVTPGSWVPLCRSLFSSLALLNSWWSDNWNVSWCDTESTLQCVSDSPGLINGA